MMQGAFVLLMISTLTGGLLPFFIGKHSNDTLLKLMLSFGGSFLFSVTILYLVPEVFGGGDNFAGIFVLLGFFFQIILEQFTGGVEHGHLHQHHGKSEKLLKMQIFFSLSLHSFMEGFPLGSTSFMHEDTRPTFLMGILLHELPASFALSTILFGGTRLRISSFLIVLAYALMAPAGATLSAYFSTGGMEETRLFHYLMAFIIGTFLHISTIILFENSPDHRFPRYKTISVILGALLASLSMLI